jgi:hypothetical protein
MPANQASARYDPALLVAKMVADPGAQRTQLEGMELLHRTMADAGFLLNPEVREWRVGGQTGGRAVELMVQDPIRGSTFVVVSFLVAARNPVSSEIGVVHSWRALRVNSLLSRDWQSPLLSAALQFVGVESEVLADVLPGTSPLSVHAQLLAELPKLAVTSEQASRFVSSLIDVLTP